MFIVVMFIQFQVTSPILALHSPQSNPSSSLRVRYLRLWVVLLWWRWRVTALAGYVNFKFDSFKFKIVSFSLNFLNCPSEPFFQFSENYIFCP